MCSDVGFTSAATETAADAATSHRVQSSSSQRRNAGGASR
jgi:hypothetical protein